MKELPEEKWLRENFMPGKVTRDGLLGSDQRHIHDIIEDDARKMEVHGIKKSCLVEKMAACIETGKRGMGEAVMMDDILQIRVRWVRGMLPCPFGERGLHHKLLCTVENTVNKMTIRYSQLSLHLIEVHGFFGGLGSSYRIEPDEIARALAL
jgi:hypothetical protein